MSRFEKLAFGVALAAVATPAFAAIAVPAPIAGVGVGAFLLIGAGYRALGRHIRK